MLYNLFPLMPCWGALFCSTLQLQVHLVKSGWEASFSVHITFPGLRPGKITLNGRAGILKDLDKLGKWVDRNFLRLKDSWIRNLKVPSSLDHPVIHPLLQNSRL